MKGSASRPSSATMNGTRCAMRPATNATSRDSRSSFETRTLHLAVRAAARAAASWGLGASVERIGALAGLGLDELGDEGEAFSFREPGNGRALRFDTEPGALLLPSRDTIVANSAFIQTAYHRLRFV